MKRLLAALCLLAAPAAASAQACASSPCTSNPITTALTVRSAVSFSTYSGLDLGSVAGGGTAAVDAQGTGTGGAAGAIVLNANQAVAISASFSPLTSAGMPNLAITPSCGWSTTNSTSIANTTLFACSGGAYTSPATGTGAGGVYVWLGGSVATTTATPAGDYAGTATITGVYTSY